MVFISLSVLPVSLKQVVDLDLPTPQLVGFCFYGTLLGMALALHGQNENFNGSVNPAAQYPSICTERWRRVLSYSWSHSPLVS